MFGSHLSIAGGLHNALIEAKQLHIQCVQIFTKNQRQWKCKPLSDDQISLWRQHRQETQIQDVVSHNSYLINLASPDPELRRRSIALFRDELLRCEALEIPYLVTHPGAHMGKGEQYGLKRVAAALDQIHRALPGLGVVTCLETTAGQGTALGWRFEHLQQLLSLTKDPERLAICVDTAHLLAGGYDLTSGAGCRRVLRELDEIIGLDHVHVIHLNDSKTPRGSRTDRHAHIGHGHVSLQAFKTITKFRKFRNVPKILETAKEIAPDGRPWDAVNLEILRSLASTKAQKSRRKKPRV